MASSAGCHSWSHLQCWFLQNAWVFFCTYLATWRKQEGGGSLILLVTSSLGSCRLPVLRHLSYTCCSLPHTTFSPVMCGTWGVGSPTRDGPGAPCSGSGVLTTESPHPAAFYFHWKSHSPNWGFLPSLACPLLGPPPPPAALSTPSSPMG